jgi:hypothetical protein
VFNRAFTQIDRVLRLVRPSLSCHPSSSRCEHQDRADVPSLCSNLCFSTRDRAWQVIARRRFDPRHLGQTRQKLLVGLLGVSANKSNATPRWLPASSHRFRASCPGSILLSPRSLVPR